MHRIITYFIPNLLLRGMNHRQLPHEYLDLCPIIDQKYKVLFKLGLGRFSKVKLGINLITNERVAIKIMNQKIELHESERGYQDRILEMFLNQVKMTLEARHRNVVQIIDFNVGGVCRTSDGKVHRILYYVMKIEQYGELFRVISQTDQFTQKTARHIFYQLLSAIKFMHAKRISHCDIKSQNILLDSKFNVRVVDFGYARYFCDQKSQSITYLANDGVGSIKCNAPELMNSQGKGIYQGNSIDIFAIGCFLFELVMKCEPFKSSEMKDEHYSKLAKQEKKKFWQIFSNKASPTLEFKDLIEKMLNPIPNERISLEEVLKHSWTGGEKPTRDEYKKEMKIRIKKVIVKIRKEQENQIKQIFMREKGKRQIINIQQFPIVLRREVQQKIMILKSMISAQDSSHSDNSSPEEVDREEQAVKLKKVNSSSSQKKS